jgi:predicted  nucleic acid-binding Zn-ribbon protein
LRRTGAGRNKRAPRDAVAELSRKAVPEIRCSYPVSPDLHHLIQLQQLETEIDTMRRRIAEIPALQEAMAARFADQQAVVASAKERLAENQAARREIEKEVAAVQTRLSRYKDQLMEVKTNKEYQAMQHEIASAQDGIRAQEDKILESMEEAEALTAALKTAEAELKQQEAAISAERTVLEAEAVELQKQADEKQGARASIAAQISAPALRLFEHVARQRKGQALAEARDGVCTVCHVRLRPQVFNEVRRNESLIQCESCLRILYFVAAAAPESAPSPSIS